MPSPLWCVGFDITSPAAARQRRSLLRGRENRCVSLSNCYYSSMQVRFTALLQPKRERLHMKMSHEAPISRQTSIRFRGGIGPIVQLRGGIGTYKWRHSIALFLAHYSSFQFESYQLLFQFSRVITRPLHSTPLHSQKALFASSMQRRPVPNTSLVRKVLHAGEE